MLLVQPGKLDRNILREHLEEEGLLSTDGSPSVIDGIYLRPDGLTELESKVATVLRFLQTSQEIGGQNARVVVIENDYSMCLAQAGWNETLQEYDPALIARGFNPTEVLVFHLPTRKDIRKLQLKGIAQPIVYPPNVIGVNNAQQIYAYLNQSKNP